ncbi:MAG: pyridine nucleotide-disulfide oxidoreductase [Betaproteobacteria bacterium HGW-Betaproteobacteria-10]|nr:MAG: pyridine nucleotide-disulfide oxidoreductase [Betaproteobacteria bacterium HGW-Betaproteobacteria-10]
MTISRRQLLIASACTLCAPTVLATPTRPKVLIIGGGWGGLSAARHLAKIGDVLLIERQPEFLSLPLSNRWLAGLDDGRRLRQNYQAAADRLGYRFRQAEVKGFDMARRQVSTSVGHFDYDWLIVAAGISEADDALLDGDKKATAHMRQHFPSAYTAGKELAVLKEKLAHFSAGEFLLNLPLAPYRCPPAPYERAVIIAQMIKSKGLKAHLTVVEPNAPWTGYQRVFREQFADQVTYLPNTQLRKIDPYQRVATLDIDEIHFDDAILMPPQQAADLCRNNGLTGKNSAWATVNPKNFAFLGDDRVFVIGDSVGAVSTLFGHYPKTGEIASRMGQIVATEITGRINDKPVELALPEGSCFAYLSITPPQFTRIESRYRIRGDGNIVQHISQQHENNPRGEDDAWLDNWHEALFGQSAKR